MHLISTKTTALAGVILAISVFSDLSFAMEKQVSSIQYDDQGLLSPADPHCFFDLDIRVGTVTTAQINKKARVPSLRVVMDFGFGFNDLKQSSAQLTDNYRAQDEVLENLRKVDLLHKQIAAVTNFPKRSVGIPSFFLTLGVVSKKGEDSGTVVITPIISVSNGAKVGLLNEESDHKDCTRLPKVDYNKTFALLDIRVGTVSSILNKTIDFGEELGVFTYSGEYPLLEEGMQVLRVRNLKGMEEKDNLLGVVEGDNLIPITLERPLPNGHFLK